MLQPVPLTPRKQPGNAGHSTRILAPRSDRKLSVSITRRIERYQTRFLTEYEKTRTIASSARRAGVSIQTVKRWRQLDTLGFLAKLEKADDLFVDSLEELALSRVQAQDEKANSLLLIALLNANKPQKYRPNVVLTDDTAKRVLEELRAGAKADLSLKSESTSAPPRPPTPHGLEGSPP